MKERDPSQGYKKAGELPRFPQVELNYSKTGDEVRIEAGSLGFIDATTRYRSDRMHIYLISVREGCQRQGVGIALLNVLEENAGRQGCGVITANIPTVDIHPGIAPFFESQGFEIQRNGIRPMAVKRLDQNHSS